MKNLYLTLIGLFFLSTLVSAQTDEKLSAWAESIAVKVELLAERVSRDVERNAEELAVIAEDLVDEIEEKIDEEDFYFTTRGWSDGYGDQDQITGYLGIRSDNLSRKKAEKLGFKNAYGSYITSVVANSAAEKAGLKLFDYVYGIEEQRTSNNQDLSDILADFEAGDEVAVYFIRNGSSYNVNVVLGDYEDFDWDNNNEEVAFLGVKPSSSERSDDMDGVSIDVVSGTAAESIGLRDDDVILGINDYPILDWSDVSTVIDNMEPDDPIAVRINRDGSTLVKKGLIEGKANTNYSVSNNDDGAWGWNDDEDDYDMDGKAFLGVYIEKISERKANALGYDNPYGSYISGIIKGTAADKAGIMPFDYIFGIDEYRVGAEQSLGGILRKYEAGDEAVVHFYRKGQRASKSVIFRSYSASDKEEKDKCQDPFFGIIQIDKSRDQKGVRVKPVKNSTAALVGLEEGDVIQYINGYMMYDWTDIGMAIDMLTPGDKIVVEYLRNGAKKTGSEKIMSYSETKKCSNCDCDDDDFSEVKQFFEGLPNTWGSRPNSSNSNNSTDNVSDMDARLSDVTNDEVRSLQSKGIDMEISNELMIRNLTLEPNSNIGMFELQFDLSSEGATTVSVFNPSGRAIYEYDLGRFSGDFSDYVDISQNGPGTYFLHIGQDGKSFVRKIALSRD